MEVLLLSFFRQGQGYHGQMVLIPETFVAEIYSRTYSLEQLQDMLDQWVKEYEQFGMKTNKIVINWKVSKTAAMEVNNSSKRFEAILHQVMKLKYDNAGVCTLLENPNPESIYFMVAQDFPFMFKPGVFGRIQSDKTERFDF